MARFLLLRTILAAWVCLGFCALSWDQLANPPSESGRLPTFQAPEEDGCPLFVLASDSTLGCPLQPGKQDSGSGPVFSLQASLAPSSPVFRSEGRAGGRSTKACGVLTSLLKNRDPPVG